MIIFISNKLGVGDGVVLSTTGGKPKVTLALQNPSCLYTTSAFLHQRTKRRYFLDWQKKTKKLADKIKFLCQRKKTDWESTQ